MSKRTLLISLILAAVLAAPAQAKEKQTINIAFWKLPLNLPAIAVFEDKTYEKAFAGEMEVNYVQLPSGPRQLQAIGAGQLDIGEGLGAAAVLTAAAGGVDLKIIGVCSRSPRGFAVVVKDSGIKTARDLQDRKVAGVRGSVVYQLYSELMDEAGLTDKDAEFYPMTLSAAAAALLAGQVDAALLAGTEIARAVKGGARVLADGTGRLEGLSLIVAGSQFAAEHPAAIEKYLQLHRYILAEMKQNPERFITMTAKLTKSTAKEAKNMINWYDFDDKIAENDITELHKTMDYLKKIKIIREKIDIMRIIYRETAK